MKTFMVFLKESFESLERHRDTIIGFCKSILENPNNLDEYLIFADFLEETNERSIANLIRASVNFLRSNKVREPEREFKNAYHLFRLEYPHQDKVKYNWNPEYATRYERGDLGYYKPLYRKSYYATASERDVSSPYSPGFVRRKIPSHTYVDDFYSHSMIPPQADREYIDKLSKAEFPWYGNSVKDISTKEYIELTLSYLFNRIEYKNQRMKKFLHREI